MIHSQQPEPTSAGSSSGNGSPDDCSIDEVASASGDYRFIDSLGESSSDESNDASGGKRRSRRSSFEGIAGMFETRAEELRRNSRPRNFENDSMDISPDPESEQRGRRSSWVRARKQPSVKSLDTTNECGDGGGDGDSSNARRQPRKRRSSVTRSIAGSLLGRSSEAVRRGNWCHHVFYGRPPLAAPLSSGAPPGAAGTNCTR